MKKTLFIQIDNTPAPIEAKKKYASLDCRQINDFCSYVGDALIGDLKDDNGIPIYRLLNPFGRLLSDFERVDKVNYDLIIAQWLKILCEILHKGVCKKPFTINFPQQYIDWLCQNEDLHYSYIGNNLKKNGSFVTLDAKGLEEDVISVLRLKIEKHLETCQDKFDYVIFSNPLIGNNSDVVKRLRDMFGNFQFLKLEHIIKKNKEQSEYEKYRGHEYVDLGLPSGLKWATCNIGASNPSDYGAYYAWAETTTKSIYGKENSKTCREILGSISGNPTCDAARANWGGSWRIPTIKELEELKNKCIWTWTSRNGSKGYLVMGRNGKSIFLPATGRRYGICRDYAGESGYYWSSSSYEASSNYAFCFTFSDSYRDTDPHRCICGLTVRAVAE